MRYFTDDNPLINWQVSLMLQLMAAWKLHCITINFENTSKGLQVHNWDAFPKLGVSELKYFDFLTLQVVTQILLSLCLKCLVQMFNLVRKRCVLWLKTSLSHRVRERGPVAVKSLWCSDFDVRLSGLSYGTEGQHSLTGLVPPFLAAQTDPVCLSVKSE